MFETLKDIITDVVLVFTPEGMGVTSMDIAKNAIVDIKLYAENFEYYSCNERTVAGVNISNLTKILKTITVNDTLEMIQNGPDILSINIYGTRTTRFQLKLLDMPDTEMELSGIEERVSTSLSSSDFQKIIRDMSNISKDVTITREKTFLTLETCGGDFVEQETTIECTDDYPSSETGRYDLKYLNMFTKAASMCSMVQIIQGSCPITIKFHVSNLGDLSFILAERDN